MPSQPSDTKSARLPKAQVPTGIKPSISQAQRKLTRLITIDTLLRSPERVTCRTISEYLDRHENIKASTKTIGRDIDELRNQYGAVIDFDGYSFCLQNRDVFELPILNLANRPVAPTQMANSIARKVLPPNLVGSLNAMEDTIKNAAPDGDLAAPELLKAIWFASGHNVKLNAGICDTVFQAWQESLRIIVRHRTGLGEHKELMVEPHAIFFTEGAWYIRARCYNEKGTTVAKEEWQSLPLHRIEDARFPTGEASGKIKKNGKDEPPPIKSEPFERDPKILEQLESGRLFNRGTLIDVEVTCSGRYREYVTYLSERKWFPGQTSLNDDTGGITLTFPNVSKGQIVGWVLQFVGRVVVKKPETLQNLVIKESLRLLQVHKEAADELKSQRRYRK